MAATTKKAVSPAKSEEYYDFLVEEFADGNLDRTVFREKYYDTFGNNERATCNVNLEMEYSTTEMTETEYDDFKKVCDAKSETETGFRLTATQKNTAIAVGSFVLLLLIIIFYKMYSSKQKR
jgi:hexokinase